MKIAKTSTKIKATVLATALLTTFAVNVNAESLVALTTTNEIGIVDSSLNNAINTNAFNNITGTAVGENFIGIDLRPSNNMIYGITTDNKIYTIDAWTGASAFVADLSQSIIDTANKSYGIDFNPVVDRTANASLRLVSSTGDNYGINVTTGAVSIATPIAAGITGVAYLNFDASTPNVAPASTELYYINTATDTLASAPSSFNNPTITTIGSLGLDIQSGSGFEITSANNAFGAFTVSTNSNNLKSYLYSVNLDTGTSEELRYFTGGLVSGLTSAPATQGSTSVVPEPESYVMLLAGLGLLGFSTRRRKNII